MKFYNTLARKKQEFKPIKEGRVGIYSCGPTVYWNQHLGHMYAYIIWDTLVRFFKYRGYQVNWVMNVTDVGHMTSDEDLGEDKIEIGAKREGLTVWQVAEKYLNQFTESMRLLNINPPDHFARVTEHIPEQIELIKKIEANGFTYKTETGLVFDTSKFPDYHRFARRKLEEQKAGARVEVDPEKKQPWDFLLWVTNQPKHIMQWDSPWGRGFPGWHIECTAISTKYLGEEFDIHTGGVEHISVHHTNEIAQAYGAFGRQTANYWLHNEWLKLKGEKMSKSKGKMLLVSDLIGKGYDPMHFRYLVLTSHYRKGINFTWESLAAAKAAYEKLAEITRNLVRNRRSNKTQTRESMKLSQGFQERFNEALADDLKTPEALAVFWEMVKSRLTAYDKYDFILDFDRVLGLKLAGLETKTEPIPAKAKMLSEKREEARKTGQWGKADKLRQKVWEMGWQIEDTSSGPRLKKIV